MLSLPSSQKQNLPKEKRPISLFLDQVRSAHNVGAAFRLADAFHISHIYCAGITPSPPHPQIRKTALGAEAAVSWSHVAETETFLEEKKKEGYQLIAIEQTKNAVPLNEKPKNLLESPCILIFGHEVFGLSATALKAADYTLMIPQYGVKKSLNVSTCIGIVLWECFR